MEGITIYWDPHLESWVNVSYLATQEDGAMVFTTTVASRQKTADKPARNRQTSPPQIGGQADSVDIWYLLSTSRPQEIKQELHRYSRPGWKIEDPT